MDSSVRTIHHLTNRLTGGVPVAIRTWISHSENFDHEIWLQSSGAISSDDWANVSARIHALSRGWVDAVFHLRRVLKEDATSVLHAHSSFAGVLAKVATVGLPNTVIYSPHCFAFERTDVSPLLQKIFKIIESTLASRRYVLAACSWSERATGTRIGYAEQNCHFIPNVADGNERRSGPKSSSHEPLVVVMSGRLSNQKDPEAFARFFERLKGFDREARAVWVGDGDQSYRELLETAGVEVTGWQAPAQVQRILDSASIYAHSAAWEGFPLSLLEAHASGLPILVRPIRAFEGYWSDAVDFENRHIVTLLNDRKWRSANRMHWESYLADNNSEYLRQSLTKLYELRPFSSSAKTGGGPA